MRLILFLIAVLSAFSLFARPVERQEAMQIAEAFLGKELTEVPMPDAGKRMPSDNTSGLGLHVFNASDGNGFVVVSGDSRTLPVLAYSDNGSFDYATAPEPVLWFLSMYEQAIDGLSAEAHDDNRMRMPNKRLRISSNAPYLLTTQWNQGHPYNLECPVINGTHAVTGCVATAMAQVINYENKTRRVSTIPDYWLNDQYLEVLPAREFNFGNLDNSEIAHLMRYCGQSVGMNYGIDESGAEVERIPEALRNYFGWEPEIHIINRSDYNNQHWNRIVSEEVAAGHPLIYSALNESGAGHAFVVDGVDNDYFHVNWGWGGTADGFYSFQPFAEDNKADYILYQRIVTLRDDDPSNDVITYGTTIGGINYELNDDLSATVLPLKNGDKYKGELVVPSHFEYEGKAYTVKYFGESAFVNCRHLTSISIPATIIAHAWSIFDGCENLRKVNVEDMAAFIKLDVGGYGTGSPLYYGADLYLNGELVKDLVIPEGVETIGFCKFAKCTSIETVTCSSTIKTIGQHSFSECPNLKKVTFNSGLKTIDIWAFNSNIALEEINLPETLETIGQYAFGQANGPGCVSLRKIVCMAANPPYIYGSDINRFKGGFSAVVYSNALVYVPDESVETYVKAKEWREFPEILPLSEEKPLSRMAKICKGKMNYEIFIDDGYAKLTGLENPEYHGDVVIPPTVEYDNKDYPIEEIGYEAFYALRLNSILIQAPIRKVGLLSFTVTRLKNILVLPATLKRISPYAFWNLSAPKVIFGENLEYIGEHAFESEEDRYNDPYSGADVFIRNFEFKGATPPVICENTFDEHQFMNSNLLVPYGAKKRYLNHEYFGKFKSIANSGDTQEIPLEYDLTLTASPVGKSLLCEGMPVRVDCQLRNIGEKTINGIEMELGIDGVPVESKTIKVEIKPGESHRLDIAYTNAIKTIGKHSLSVKGLPSGKAIDGDLADNEAVIDFNTTDGFYRVSLIEQFTSEQCGITPYYNGKIFNAIEETGEHDFVAHIFNHCGFYDDFLTLNHDYAWFYNDWGYTYTPAVMLNRTDVRNTGYTPVMGINDQFALDLAAASQICNARVSVFMETGEKICVKTVLEKDASFDINDGYDYVTVFLVEDSIPARQQYDAFIGDYMKDYIHRNVLRKVLTLPWGEVIQWNGDKCLYKFESEINPEWKIKNLSAVAFIHRYNPDSPVDCQVYSAGASYLPQYTALPDVSANWVTWNSDALRLALNRSSMNMKIDDEKTIKAMFKPDDYEGRIIWSSDNQDIVRISYVDDESSSAGIRAYSEGTAKIVAQLEGTELKAYCDITVSNKDGVAAITVDESAEVKIYNLAGIMVYEGIYSDAQLDSGVYIVETQNRRYKHFVR